MNVIARLPDCAGQAADAVSACTLSQSVQIFEYVFHDTSGQTLGPVLKTLWFFLNEIFLVTHLWERLFETALFGPDGKKTELGQLMCASKAMSILGRTHG